MSESETELRTFYRNIPEKNFAAVGKLHAAFEVLREKQRALNRERKELEDAIVRLLTDIRPGDLVKHDPTSKYLRKSEIPSVYLIVETALKYGDVSFFGRKMRKDGTPTERVTEIYVYAKEELIRVGRYRRVRTRLCST